MDEEGDFLGVTIGGKGFVPGINMTILEVSIGYGRCYTLRMDWPMRYKDYYTLHLNFTQIESLVLFAHEAYVEIGLNFGFWPEKPASIWMKRGDDLSLVFSQSFHIYKHTDAYEHCSDRDQGYSFPKCVHEWAKATYSRLWKNGTGTRTWGMRQAPVVVGSILRHLCRLLVSLGPGPGGRTGTAHVQDGRGGKVRLERELQ